MKREFVLGELMPLVARNTTYDPVTKSVITELRLEDDVIQQALCVLADREFVRRLTLRLAMDYKFIMSIPSLRIELDGDTLTVYDIDGVVISQGQITTAGSHGNG